MTLLLDVGKYLEVQILGSKNTKDLASNSGILKIKYVNPENIIVQHVPVKEKVEKQKVNSSRSGFLTNTSTSVDVLEIVRIGNTVIEIFGEVSLERIFNFAPF